MIDFIGDIHGHADKLEALLKKLGYAVTKSGYAHPERKALFVGDYIDRGPQIKETLQIVRNMVESENAIALMGNHEYNAICFHYEEREGGHLRKHAITNIIQHYETLRQFQNMQSAYEAYIDWFKILPLFYETEQFRAVHACWDTQQIGYLQQTLVNNRLTDELIHQSVIKERKLNHAIDCTLKGKEIAMPGDAVFVDKDGTHRTEIRIKWWEDPARSTYQSISIEKLPQLPETPVVIDQATNADYYHPQDKPVFFGHYWLKGNPTLYKKNICCLDYSVAKQGHLVAYRFNGEKELSDGQLVYV